MTRNELNGVFDESDLDRLTWPIAWCGTVPQSERDERESELSAFVAEAREAIRESLAGNAVRVVNGEIETVLFGDDE